MAWRQGEHLTLVGSTGSGKTTLAKAILKHRKYVIVLLTKADTLAWPGYHTVATAEKIRYNPAGTRVIVKPPDDPQTGHIRQHMAVKALLQRVWEEGGWCIYIDEMYYIQHVLKLQSYCESLLTQGRSKHISMVLGVQRPAWVSRFALSEPIHVLSSKLRDGRDIATMKMVAGDEYASELSKLKRYEFGYLNRDTMSYRVVNRTTVSDALEALYEPS